MSSSDSENVYLNADEILNKALLKSLKNPQKYIYDEESERQIKTGRYYDYCHESPINYYPLNQVLYFFCFINISTFSTKSKYINLNNQPFNQINNK